MAHQEWQEESASYVREVLQNKQELSRWREMIRRCANETDNFKQLPPLKDVEDIKFDSSEVLPEFFITVCSALHDSCFANKGGIVVNPWADEGECEEAVAYGNLVQRAKGVPRSVFGWLEQLAGIRYSLREPEHLPSGWEDNAEPPEEFTVEAILTWLDAQIVAMDGLSGTWRIAEDPNAHKLAASVTVRNAFRLVDELRKNGYDELPYSSQDEYSPESAKRELGKLRDVLKKVGEGEDVQELKELYSDPGNFDRDRWILEQRLKDRTWTDIQEELNTPGNHPWMPLESDGGCLRALKSICGHLKVDVPKGKPGRRSKTPNTPK